MFVNKYAKLHLYVFWIEVLSFKILDTDYYAQYFDRYHVHLKLQ